MCDQDKEFTVKVQVLPYLGKPEPSKREKARKNWKPPTVVTNGTYTKQPKIKLEEDDYN